MKLALPLCRERSAPVFDVAGRVLLLTLEAGVETAREELLLSGADGWVRVQTLLEHGVTELICGAVSRPVQLFARLHGMRVHSFVTGTPHELLAAWQAGTLLAGAFTMPGCQRGRRCRRSCGVRNNPNPET